MLAESQTVMHNPEAEEALLAAVMVNPEVLPEVRDLPAEAFFVDRNRWVWEAILRLAARGSVVDPVLLAGELATGRKLEEVGGWPRLTELLTRAGYSYNAPEYASILRGALMRRKLLAAANHIARLASEAGEPLELLTRAVSAVRGAGESLAPDEDGLSLKDLAALLYDQAVERARTGVPRAASRIPTGWRYINEFLGGGFAPGKLYIVAGRPGEGKSTWLTNAAYHAALNGRRVALFSLEMEQLEVAARILAAQTGLNANLLTDGILRETEQWEAFHKGIEVVEAVSMHVFFTPRLTPESLRARAHRFQAAHGLDMLIVDYLQLMSGDRRAANRQEEVAAISREMKILAGELRVPVLAAAQLNRAVEQRAEREPQLSDLRESGALENDADLVAFVYRPDPDNKFASITKFAKNRGGEVGKAALKFNAALYRFEG